MALAPTRLFLLRHGETDYNAQGIVQGGGIDSSLNATGRAQALRFYYAYGHHPFAGLYVSSLKRTYETLAPFASLGHVLGRLADLNEFNWGQYEGRPYDEALRTEVQPLREAWATGRLDCCIPGGESPLAVQRRALRAVETILERHRTQGGDLLVCTHGRLLCILVSGLLGTALAQMEQYKHPNTGLSVLRVTSAGYVPEQLAEQNPIAP
jgi:probable phosphoglycerate mutase